MATVFKRKRRVRGKLKVSNRYSFTYTDENGKRVTRSTNHTDAVLARRDAKVAEAHAAAKRAERARDPRAADMAGQRMRRLSDHVADYKKKMQAAKRAPSHIGATLRYIEAVSASGKWQTVDDITADDLNHYAAELHDAGKSARTVQASLTACMGFTRWLLKTRKLPSDPLVSVEKPNPAKARKRERRYLLPEEWDWLRKTLTAPDAPDYHGAIRPPLPEGGNPKKRIKSIPITIPAWDRLMLYGTAIQSGYRAGELRSLTRGLLHPDVAKPFIRCRASDTKNAKKARQYVTPSLAAMLAELAATKTPTAPVFKMPRAEDVAAMLRADLKRARDAWIAEAGDDPQEAAERRTSNFLAPVDDEGHRLDFHALRHTTARWSILEGDQPDEVQRKMRHSSITLTMDLYGDHFHESERRGVPLFAPMLDGN